MIVLTKLLIFLILKLYLQLCRVEYLFYEFSGIKFLYKKHSTNQTERIPYIRFNCNYYSNILNINKLKFFTMKKTSFTLLAILLFVFATNAQKVGYIDGDKVFLKMAEVKKADSTLKLFIADYENYAKKLNDEYTLKVNEFKEKEATMSELVKKSEVESINALNEKIKKYQISAQEEINKKRTELYQPLVEKFNAALKKVAEKKGLRGVLDTNKSGVLYYNPADEVSKLVEAELGIKG